MPPRPSRASSRTTPSPYANRSHGPDRQELPSRISRGYTSQLYGIDELPPVGTGLVDVNTSLAFAAELGQEVEKAEQLASQARLESSSQPPTSPLGNRPSQLRSQSHSQPRSHST